MIQAKDLKLKFIEALTGAGGFSYEAGNPFVMNIRGKQYSIFLKNLSPAYFKNLPDITRVQLPFSNHFGKISRANVPFVILGYDTDNDVVVCWDHKRVKERLNARSNVSLYSRKSLQSKTRTGEFTPGVLSNGDKIILFKREMLVNFFKNFNGWFSEYKIEESSAEASDLVLAYQPIMLRKIDSSELLSQLRPLLRRNRVLEAVEICIKHYGNKYKAMNFKDWFKLINDLYQVEKEK